MPWRSRQAHPLMRRAHTTRKTPSAPLPSPPAAMQTPSTSARARSRLTRQWPWLHRVRKRAMVRQNECGMGYDEENDAAESNLACANHRLKRRTVEVSSSAPSGKHGAAAACVAAQAATVLSQTRREWTCGEGGGGGGSRRFEKSRWRTAHLTQSPPPPCAPSEPQREREPHESQTEPCAAAVVPRPRDFRPAGDHRVRAGHPLLGPRRASREVIVSRVTSLEAAFRGIPTRPRLFRSSTAARGAFRAHGHVHALRRRERARHTHAPHRLPRARGRLDEAHRARRAHCTSARRTHRTARGRGGGLRAPPSPPPLPASPRLRG